MIEGLRPPRLIPHPCSQAATDRNWDAVREAINDIHNHLNTLGGTRIAEVLLQPDPDECVKEIVYVSQFRPLFLDDPADPMPHPTDVDNRRGFGVAQNPGTGLNPKGYIAYDPNLERWELIEVDHVHTYVVTGAEKVEGGLALTGSPFTIIPCFGETTTISTIETVKTSMIRLLDKDDCSIMSKSTEVEVFSSTPSDDYVSEILFEEVVNLIGDIYQDGDGNIVAYYTPIRPICSGVPFEEIVLYTDPCVVD